MLPAPSLEYIHHSIDLGEVKYKNRNLIPEGGSQSFLATVHLTVCLTRAINTAKAQFYGEDWGCRENVKLF